MAFALNFDFGAVKAAVERFSGASEAQRARWTGANFERFTGGEFPPAGAQRVSLHSSSLVSIGSFGETCVASG